ncbi:MAG: hypothetical protein WB524_20205 [Acidobacteriaceae bacterium]
MDAVDLIEQSPATCWAVLGDPVTREFVTWRLVAPPPPNVKAEYIARGFLYVALVAIVKGVPRTRLMIPLDDETARAAAEVVIEAIGREMERRLSDPVVEERAAQAAFATYMQHLMKLPDA